MKGEATSPGFRFTREEISGSSGDLGTFLAGPGNVKTGILFRGLFRGKENGSPSG